MQKEQLQIAHYINKHPVLLAKHKRYKLNYLRCLDYFIQNYSQHDMWANSSFQLYKNSFLNNPEEYYYVHPNYRNYYKFHKHKYCFIIDVIFICAFNDQKKANRILGELSNIYSPIIPKQKLMTFIHGLFDFNINSNKFKRINDMYFAMYLNKCFRQKKEKKILVTANMSAGKSTLLNTLIGKKVNKTQNDSCTAKVHYIYNKPFEDELIYEWDHDLNLNASYSDLMEDNPANDSSDVIVGTRFRSLYPIDQKICFIDTPGVNSSQDKDHKEISEFAIKNFDYDILLYMLNGENIGTFDDQAHLKFVSENYKGKIIFVVNKLDRFKKEDSVSNTLRQLELDLKKLGFSNPIICPISAYAGYLAKMDLFHETLNEDELDELEFFSRKLKKETFRFDLYHANTNIPDIPKNNHSQLLLHSGILTLESFLFN